MKNELKKEKKRREGQRNYRKYMLFSMYFSVVTGSVCGAGDLGLFFFVFLCLILFCYMSLLQLVYVLLKKGVVALYEKKGKDIVENFRKAKEALQK